MSDPQVAAPAAASVTATASCVALLDANGRIEWASPGLHDLLGLPATALSGRSLGELAGESAGQLAEDGAILDWRDAGGRSRRLRVEYLPVDDRRLLLLHDLTELETLQARIDELEAQIRDLKLTDDLTGLPNRRAITQALDLQISRSRRYGNPLSLVLVETGIAEQPLELLGEAQDALVLAVSHFLRDRLRWVDQIGRWEDDRFLLILPETDREQAEQLVAKIDQELGGLQLPPSLEGLRPQLRFGLAFWTKGNDRRTLTAAVERQLAGT